MNWMICGPSSLLHYPSCLQMSNTYFNQVVCFDLHFLYDLIFALLQIHYLYKHVVEKFQKVYYFKKEINI